MQSFESDGVRIAYTDEGEGDPILLIHGFASNVATNWRDTHWLRTLTKASHRTIAYDNRGHGRSEKLYDPSRYGAPIMAEDARRLLDHLGTGRADVMGYSMGARIATFLVLAHPERVRSLILAGAGINLVRGMVGTGPIARALEAPRIASLRRADRERFEGARRLPAGPAREDRRRRSGPHRRTHPHRHRQRGRDRRLGQGVDKLDSRRPTP